jgi:hypothetical protein
MKPQKPWDLTAIERGFEKEMMQKDYNQNGSGRSAIFTTK